MNGSDGHVIRPPRLLIVLVGIGLLSLACNSLPGGGAVATEEPTHEIESTEATQEEPATEAPATEAPTTEAPTEEPIPQAGGLTADNADTLHEVRVLDGAPSLLLAGAISPTEHLAASFGFDKYVRWWDLDSFDMLSERLEHAQYGYGLAFSPDGARLASGGGYQVVLWDTATQEPIRTITVNAFVYRLVWSPDNIHLAVVGEDSSRIFIINANTGSQEDEIRTSAGNVLWAAAYTRDNTMLAVGDFDGNVTVLNPETGATIFEDTSTARGAPWDIEFSPDGSMLASCNGSGGIYIWDTSTWDTLFSNDDIHPGGCTDGVFSPGSDVYLSVGTDGVLNAWAMPDTNLLISEPVGVTIWTISISGDGQLIALSMDDGACRIW